MSKKKNSEWADMLDLAIEKLESLEAKTDHRPSVTIHDCSFDGGDRVQALRELAVAAKANAEALVSIAGQLSGEPSVLIK
jgi:hypothetical protein